MALLAHNHDGRYDLLGAATAVGNVAAAFDASLQGANALTLYAQDLYRETTIDTLPGWLDWQVQGVQSDPTVWTWAHWEGVVMNADNTVDEDQIPDFGASDYGQYAWILDPDGNYRVPQEWQDGDHYANIGPDGATACYFYWYWYGGYWCSGETVVDDTVIDAVDTGYYGSDYTGSYDESSQSTISWHVSDDRQQVSYSIDWQPSANAPQFQPWYVETSYVQAQLLIRPAAADAFVWDSGIWGYVFDPNWNMLGLLGNGPVDPPIEMQDGCFLSYYFTDPYPNVNYETPVYMGQSWLYGYERHNVWLQVPSSIEVTNTVNAAITGDTTRYLKGDVDAIVQSARDDLGAQVQSARDDLGAWISTSTNLLAPALAGQFLCATVTPDTNRVIALAWTNSPFLSIRNTNNAFLVLPPMPTSGLAANLYFDCLGTNALLPTRSVIWASAPPSGKGLYQLFGNPQATNAWRGWAVPETRTPVAYTQFVYSLPPQGPISNGLFASPVSVTLGNGATSNALPPTISVICKEQTTNVWTAFPLSRMNFYAGDVYLPFGLLSVAFSNAADSVVTAMPPFTVQSGYHYILNSSDAYPATGAWTFEGVIPSSGNVGGSSWLVDTGGWAEQAPGFNQRCIRTGGWGGCSSDGAIRSPAITGLVTNVRAFLKTISGVIYVEYCPLGVDRNAGSNWQLLHDGITTDMTWQWFDMPVNRTNGYIRVREGQYLIQNGVSFLCAYIDIR